MIANKIWPTKVLTAITLAFSWWPCIFPHLPSTNHNYLYLIFVQKKIWKRSTSVTLRCSKCVHRSKCLCMMKLYCRFTLSHTVLFFAHALTHNSDRYLFWKDNNWHHYYFIRKKDVYNFWKKKWHCCLMEGILYTCHLR